MTTCEVTSQQLLQLAPRPLDFPNDRYKLFIEYEYDGWRCLIASMVPAEKSANIRI
jgi:hypothetical protein